MDGALFREKQLDETLGFQPFHLEEPVAESFDNCE